VSFSEAGQLRDVFCVLLASDELGANAVVRIPFMVFSVLFNPAFISMFCLSFFLSFFLCLFFPELYIL
jgi:hypothetical protein